VSGNVFVGNCSNIQNCTASSVSGAVTIQGSQINSASVSARKTGEKKMPMPLSREMREKIIFHKENGEKEKEISKWLHISESSVTKIWRIYKKQKTIAPKPHKKGRKPAFSAGKMEEIVAKIREQPDITLSELIEQFGLPISISALSRKITKLNLTFKKRRCLPKNSGAKMCNNYGESG